MNNIKENNINPKVLLIEDNELNQLYFTELLEGINIDYIVCEGEEDALIEFKKNNFQLVISDVDLKDGNGIQIVKHVNNVNDKIPCILISGSSESELIEKYGDFNCTMYLTKPIKKADFISAVSSCLLQTVVVTEEKANLSSKYNFENLIRILKSDTEKINTCLREFIELVGKSIIEVEQSFISKDVESLRPLFHDLLNLCPYFGADLLFNLVMKYRAQSTVEEKISSLPAIKKELVSIKSYYTSPSFKIL